MKFTNGYCRVIAVTTACFFATALFAQEQAEEMMEEAAEEVPPLYTSEIEIGGGYVSEDSLKFGEYNGLEDDGGFVIGNIRLRKHMLIGDDDNEYWELSGSNLGLDSRSVYGEYSRDGSFRVFFDYDQIPHNQFDDGRTPFIGAGTTDQTLPAGWVGGTSTSGLTALIPSLIDTGDIETERQRLGGGFKWFVAENWTVKGDYRHEIKDGTDTIGAVFGTNGGNPRSSILVRPIDYDVDEFDAGIAYTGEKGQYSLNYHLSLFDNDNNALIWDNPFNLSIPFVPPGNIWSSGASFGDGARGRIGYEPDNEAWQITFAGGYNLTQRTRVTANVSYGQMEQNETFLPFSSVFPAPIPLPRDNLDGEIETLYANLNLSTRLTDRLDLRARYTYDDRDNNSPRDIYVQIASDAGEQEELVTPEARVNWPYDLERHQVELDAGYRLAPMTRLSVGYEFESKDRNFTEVESTDEHAVNVKVTTTPFETASAWLRFEHSVRDGSTYVSNQPLLTGRNPAFIDFALNDPAGDPDELFENDPLLRKFHIADRDRDQLSAAVNFYPIEAVSFTVGAKYDKDDFEDSEVGVQESGNTSLSMDADFTPSDAFGAHAFLTYEDYDYKQRGFSHPGFLGPLTPTTDRVAVFGDAWWTVDSEDDIYTFGTGVDWVIIEDKFNVKVDYLYSHAVTETTPDSQGLLFLPLPDLKSNLHRLSLLGEYRFRENMGLRFRYLFESFDTSDFALDLVEPDTLANVILLGNGAFNYDEHVIGISYFYNY